MFNKILIANRGEIACRIIKTARRMGVESVAVYSSADRDGLHVALADSAFCVGPPAATESYLNIEAIINAALASGAQAIHPGYGFLSENPDMARACKKANIVFIGPSISAMETMASKQLAKQLLEETSIPLTPGYHGKDQSDEKLHQEALRLGFPILLKAANGGGGKGMRTVTQETDFFQALASARREAKASFADDTMLIEKLMLHPRHIEIQIMADHHGHIVHLYERDCSVQRRHQKIIEEATAPSLSDELRQKIAQAAIEVARAIDYRGAGTVEFLVDKEQNFYFMEMNTRLQVEHPVTEMVTGLDLVEWQLRIAANEPLPCTQAQIKARGHAIECRIYAEDPRHDFLPSTGQLHFLQEPMGDGIRIDSGVTKNSIISRYYDPMIAKLIAWGEDRQEALQRLQHALKHYYIGGVKTNIPFLTAICQHPSFINAELSTHFLTDHSLNLPQPDVRLALLMATSFDYLNLYDSLEDPLRADTFAWQWVNQMQSTDVPKDHLSSRHWCVRYLIGDIAHEVTVVPINAHTLTIQLAQETVQLQIKCVDQHLTIDDGHRVQRAILERISEQLILFTEQGPITIERFHWQPTHHEHHSAHNQLTAPMPATLVAILKNLGDNIKTGERLFVLEAMKMEHTIYAPEDGKLVELFYDIGAQVNEGAALGRIQQPSVKEKV